MSCSHAARVALQSIAVFTLISALALGGGFTNRIRGGWLNLDPQFTQSDDDFTHNLRLRAIFGAPTAGIALTAGLFTPKAWFFAFSVLVWGTMSLYVGWGTYFDMGRSTTAYLGRAGVFDWLVCAAGPTWGFVRRWVRDAPAMALRGMLQTAVPGLLMFSMGYGPGYLLSGVAMAVAYEVAEDIPYKGDPDFAQGTPLAEFIWGWYTWFMLLITILPETLRTIARVRNVATNTRLSVNRAGYTALPDADAVVPFLSRDEHAPAAVSPRAFSPAYGFALAALHVGLLLLDGVCIYSSIWYARTPTTDARNKAQSEIGLLVVTCGLVALHLISVVLAIPIWRRAYDLRVDLTTATELVMAERAPFWRALWVFIRPAEDAQAQSRRSCVRRLLCPNLRACVSCSKWLTAGMSGIVALRRLLNTLHAILLLGVIGLVVYGRIQGC